MATYSELAAVAADRTSQTEALRVRIQVASVLACEAIRQEVVTTPNHAARVAWAVNVMNSPGAWQDRVLWAVLAQNSTATTAQILAADDATVLAKVLLAVNLLAGGIA